MKVEDKKKSLAIVDNGVPGEIFGDLVKYVLWDKDTATLKENQIATASSNTAFSNMLLEDYADPDKIRAKYYLGAIKKRAKKEGRIEDENSRETLKQILETQNHTLDHQKKIIERLDKHQEETLLEIRSLKQVLADKEDLLASEKRIRQDIESESVKVQDSMKNQISALKESLTDFLPHKRAFKTSLYFASLFIGCFLVNFLFETVIIKPFWNFLGMLISFLFLIYSYALYSDWEKGTEMSIAMTSSQANFKDFNTGEIEKIKTNTNRETIDITAEGSEQPTPNRK